MLVDNQHVGFANRPHPPFMNAPTLRPAAHRPFSRNTAVVLAVVALHVGAIWALQSGLLMRALEIVVPVELLSQFVEPPAPKAVLRPPAPPVPLEQPKKAVAKMPTPQAPLPVAINNPAPAPKAPTGTIEPQTAQAPVAQAPVAFAPVAAAPAAPPAPPAVQQPSSDADYLQNPKPAYPSISRRLNEQGKTTVRVLIGTDGLPQRAEVSKSSGFSRLDDAALATVMRWRYVPGKRGGVAEAMWFNVPINWVLE